MTPEEVRKLLAGTTPGPWEAGSWNKQEVDCPEVTEFWITGHNNIEVAVQETIERHRDETESDFSLMAAAPDMAAMIAGMTAEYAVIHQPFPGSEWHQVTRWSKSKNPLNKGYELADDERIIVRYVTAPQPLGEEQ